MDTLGPVEGDEGARKPPPLLVADTSLTQDDTSYIPNNGIPDCSSAALYANVWHIEDCRWSLSPCCRIQTGDCSALACGSFA